MLDQNKITTLRSTRTDLEKKLTTTESTLNLLHVQKESLIQKTTTLNTRTSSLAQTILKKTKQELEAINKEIVQLSIRKQQLMEEILANQLMMQKEDEENLDLKKQASTMISDFLKYMENHLEDFGTEIKKTFRIQEKVNFGHSSVKFRSDFFPSGNFFIYDLSKHFTITQSTNIFHFEHTLYTRTYKETGIITYCSYIETDWYKNYRKQFISIILETLEKNYSYNNFFKLTIEESSFTLELV